MSAGKKNCQIPENFTRTGTLKTVMVKIRRKVRFLPSLVARISLKEAFSARKATNMVKSKPESSFLVKRM